LEEEDGALLVGSESRHNLFDRLESFGWTVQFIHSVVHLLRSQNKLAEMNWDLSIIASSQFNEAIDVDAIEIS
jgi:hypothetical protein